MIQFEQTTLSENEKKLIKEIKQHPAWQVIKKIEFDQRLQLGTALLSADIENEEDKKKIKLAQVYAQARQDFVSAIEENTLEVVPLTQFTGENI